MHKLDRLIAIVIAAVLLAGCGRSALVAATRTAVPIFTPAPTMTALPTTTVTSTPTLVPSSTPTPTLEPTAIPEPTATDPPPTDVSPTNEPTAAAIDAPLTIIDPQIGQHPYTLTLQLVNTSGVTQSFSIGFLLYLPRTYGQDSTQVWPMVLFLHGSGENGADPAQVAANGLPELVADDADFPFIMVSPQAPDGVVWWGTELDQVAALLDYIQANTAVDPKREYLTGLSMGGFGAWAMVVRYPQRFAAVVPIAGGWNSENDTIPSNICAIKDVPIWAFHGEQDEIVSPRKSQMMVDALQQCGSAVRFTLYPDADHRGSWTRAYADPELYDWLLAQHLP